MSEKERPIEEQPGPVRSDLCDPPSDPAAWPGGEPAMKTVQQVAEITKACSFPRALLHVLEATSDERVDQHRLARAVEADPDLAKRVLSVARGPLYLTYNDRSDQGGLAICNLPNAILKIGFAGVRNIAFTQSICVLAREGHELSGAIAAHSLVVAEIARALGRAKHVAIGEDAYLCGLLHDYGKLALLRALGTEYLHVATWCRRERLAAIAAERDIIAPGQRHLRDHAHCGAEILRLQGLPDGVVACARRHHEDMRMHVDGWDSWSMTGIVIVADRLAYLAGYNDGLAGHRPEARETEELAALLARPLEEMDALIEAAVARSRETMAGARITADTRVVSRIGELYRRAPLAVRTLPDLPQPLNDEYRACLALIEFAREQARFTAAEAGASLTLDETAARRLLARFLERGYLARVSGDGGLLPESGLEPTAALLGETTETVLTSLGATMPGGQLRRAESGPRKDRRKEAA